MDEATRNELLLLRDLGYTHLELAVGRWPLAEDEMTTANGQRPTANLLADVAAAHPRPFVVAFAAETDAVEDNARQKLLRKNADLIVANNVADNSIGFDSDQNEVLVIARDGSSTKIDRAPKIVVANRILDLIVERVHG